MSKKYPLEIEFIYGGTRIFMSRGHHHFDDFMIAVEIERENFRKLESEPAHGFAKVVPCNTGEYKFWIEFGDVKSRGSFPCTYICED